MSDFDFYEGRSAGEAYDALARRRENAEAMRWRRISKYLFWFLVLAVATIAWLSWEAGKGTQSTAYAPRLIEMSVEEAKAELAPLGMRLIVEKDGTSEGNAMIIGQEPEPGAGLQGRDAIKVKLKERLSKLQTMVNVPDLKGLSPSQVRDSLDDVGLKANAQVLREANAAGLTLMSQDPKAGSMAASGSAVKLSFGRKSTAAPAAAGGATKPKAKPRPAALRYVVCIDPGHQAGGDGSQEPIGPGATETKPAVAGGATGTSTGRPEYAVVLEIAMKVRSRLLAKGVKVVMTRTSNDAVITNSERAKVANSAGADLFLRIHCDGGAASVSGVSTLYPGGNSWVAPISEKSRRAADLIHSAVLRSTGANDRGVVQRSDLAGFNWSKVPSVLVETGFLSNAHEDGLLNDPAYQDKLAAGMAEGTMSFLRGG